MPALKVLLAASVAAALLAFKHSLRAGESVTNTLVASQTRPFDPALSGMRLHTVSNQVLNAAGKAVRLHGVNIASLEWRNEGENVAASVDRAVREWKANLIRLPLAQDRWFGRMPNQSAGGTAYRALVDKLVDFCAANKAYIVLDLHWSNTGRWANEGGKLGQHVMPDLLSIDFWRDVATRYKSHPNVIFCLYNEPHDVSWTVWRDGGTVIDVPAQSNPDQSRVTYAAVGMQKLYEVVRATGANNVASASGLDWGYDLSGVLEGYALNGRDIIYETHPYPQKKEWDKCVGEVSKKFPVFIGEWGAGANGLDYGRQVMDFVDRHGIQMWAAWDFHPQAGPTLIRNWSYAPTVFGQFVKDRLAARAAERASEP